MVTCSASQMLISAVPASVCEVGTEHQKVYVIILRILFPPKGYGLVRQPAHGVSLYLCNSGTSQQLFQPYDYMTKRWQPMEGGLGTFMCLLLPFCLRTRVVCEVLHSAWGKDTLPPKQVKINLQRWAWEILKWEPEAMTFSDQLLVYGVVHLQHLLSLCSATAFPCPKMGGKDILLITRINQRQ